MTKFDIYKEKSTKIFRTKDFSMFSNDGNQFVYTLIKKFRLGKRKEFKDWELVLDNIFIELISYLKKQKIPKKFSEIYDTAVIEKMYIALL